MQACTVPALVAATLVSACGVAGDQSVSRNSIVNGGATDFAIFAANGEASAVRLGSTVSADMVANAVAAIRQSTGCGVDPKTLRYDDKSVQARLSC